MALRQPTQILYWMWHIKSTSLRICWFKQKMPGCTMSMVHCSSDSLPSKTKLYIFIFFDFPEKTCSASTQIWINWTKIWRVHIKYANRILSKCKRVWMQLIQCWNRRFVYGWEVMLPKWCHCSKWLWRIKMSKRLCESSKRVKIEPKTRLWTPYTPYTRQATIRELNVTHTYKCKFRSHVLRHSYRSVLEFFLSVSTCINAAAGFPTVAQHWPMSVCAMCDARYHRKE